MVLIVFFVTVLEVASSLSHRVTVTVPFELCGSFIDFLREFWSA